MDTVYINWGEGSISFNQIKDFRLARLDRKGFYALLGAIYDNDSGKWGDIKLLYIGQAFDQTLRERIPQEHPYACMQENGFQF